MALSKRNVNLFAVCHGGYALSAVTEYQGL